MTAKTRFALAIGSTLAASAAMSTIAHAADSPFTLTRLSAGYQLAEADSKQKDGKCGEAKCGANKKAKEAKCGADKAKDGSCGAEKKATEGNCGGNKKMGDGSCGANKK